MMRDDLRRGWLWLVGGMLVALVCGRVLGVKPAEAAGGGRAGQVVVDTSAGVFLYEPGGVRVWRWTGESWGSTHAELLDR